MASVVVAYLCAGSAVTMNTGLAVTDQISRVVVLVADSLGMVTVHLAVRILVSMVVLDLDVMIMSRA
jgi:ABC-type sulfate transport system permease component